jgi:hypothetical protein
MKKMIKKIIVTCVLFLAVIDSASSQEDDELKRLPSIYIGTGVLSFNGDVGKGLDISSLTRIRSGFMFGIEQRVGSCLGFSLNGLIGKLANSDHSSSSNLNFETPIKQADLSLVFHFDNNFIFKKTSVIAPYLQIGISYLKFDPHGDLKDKNGTLYNYWADGTIRNLPETTPPPTNSVIIQRDYSYETQLKDPKEDYKRSSLALPLAVGLKLNATQRLALNLTGTYYMAFTDYLDNVKNGKSDSYIFANVSIEYKIFKKPKANDMGSVDFASLDKSDLDEDGVADKDDDCPGTFKGTMVDAHGCPVDTDGDGVPDYKDKEINSLKGAIVDESGVTQTDKTIAEKSAKTDSLATERSQIFNQNPNLGYLKGIENKVKEERKTNPPKTKIPAALQVADKNKDGLITTNEITEAIDAFFDGSASFTIEKINSLIDYFFEQ